MAASSSFGFNVYGPGPARKRVRGCRVDRVLLDLILASHAPSTPS